jgi:hypothetical protein
VIDRSGDPFALCLSASASAGDGLLQFALKFSDATPSHPRYCAGSFFSLGTSMVLGTIESRLRLWDILAAIGFVPAFLFSIFFSASPEFVAYFMDCLGNRL